MGMIKKGLLIFCLLLAAFVFLPPYIDAQEENSATESAEDQYNFASMTTYELFWPIVPGKVPGDKFYNLKVWRDKIASFFIFNKLKKVEHLKKLANKRLVEAERLVELQRYSFFFPTLEKAKENLGEGLKLLATAKKKSRYNWVKNEYAKDVRKHLVVLERMKEKVEEKEKASVEEFLKSTQGLIDEYQLEIAPENF